MYSSQYLNWVARCVDVQILYLKIQKIQEALRVTQKANREFHSDAAELTSTQDKIIKLFLGPEREEYVAKGISKLWWQIYLFHNLASHISMEVPIHSSCKIEVVEKKMGVWNSWEVYQLSFSRLQFSDHR